MAIFNPSKKMTLTWPEYCRMEERYLDEVQTEREKEKSKKEEKSVKK